MTRLAIFFLLAGIALIYIGTRHARNRRRKGVLPAPSDACRRNPPEAPC